MTTTSHPDLAVPQSPWSSGPSDIVQKLTVDPATGLSRTEVQRRLARYGLNEFQHQKPRNAFLILVRQFKGSIVVLLAVGAVAAFLFGEYIEAGAIVAVLLLNGLLGFATELVATRSMEALRRLSDTRVRVRREGTTHSIESTNLVPGDIIVVQAGDAVAADMRVLEASTLEVDESALTGESLPTSKSPEPVTTETELAERSSMMYQGTAVTRGSGIAVVTATANQTELGEVSRLVGQARSERTPLERKLSTLGRRLIWLTLAVSALVAIMGVISGKPLYLVIETAIALAVAAVPEGLPIIATIALGRGMHRMAKQNALVRRLSAVETLGSATILLSDKTGTLTENRMAVSHVQLDPSAASEWDSGNQAAVHLLEICALCNNASPNGSGDPLELALIKAAANQGVEVRELRNRMPRVREVPFEADTKLMATVHDAQDHYLYAVKGAPEAVLPICTSYDGQVLSDLTRKKWLDANDQLATDGLRVIAVAKASHDTADRDPYGQLELVGLVALRDPPRAGVDKVIAGCRRAGISIAMVTGDQGSTALSIARDIGIAGKDDRSVSGQAMLEADEDGQVDSELLSAPVYHRVTPAGKLALIRAHQRAGAIVAMTGDGVNDAPALKQADIGIAMGQRGTEVAREAADVVLKDDSLETLLSAIGQGRVIFSNIRRFVVYLLSCNLSEILVIGLAVGVRGPLPILPLQILFLNLVTDVFPALALGMGRGDPNVLNSPPRSPDSPILDRVQWRAIVIYSILITVTVLGALALAMLVLRFPEREAVTVSFYTLAFAQLWHVFNMRERGASPFNNTVTRNPWVWAAIVLCSGLLALTVYVPALSGILSVTEIGVEGWLLVLVASILPLCLSQLWSAIRGNRATKMKETTRPRT